MTTREAMKKKIWFSQSKTMSGSYDFVDRIEGLNIIMLRFYTVSKDLLKFPYHFANKKNLKSALNSPVSTDPVAGLNFREVIASVFEDRYYNRMKR